MKIGNSQKSEIYFGLKKTIKTLKANNSIFFIQLFDAQGASVKIKKRNGDMLHFLATVLVRSQAAVF